MYFKPIACLLLILGLWSYQANAQSQTKNKQTQAQKTRYTPLTCLTPRAYWARHSGQTVTLVKRKITLGPASLTRSMGRRKDQAQQKLHHLKGKTHQVTQYPDKLLNKTKKVTEMPQKLAHGLQQKGQQSLTSLEQAPKKLSGSIKEKLGKIRAAQQLVDDLEARTGGKMSEWTQKLTIPEMRQLQEARQLLQGADAQLQQLIPENLTNHRVFQDLNKWTSLDGLNLDQFQDLPALQSLQKMQKLQNLGALGNLKGLSMLGKYGNQAQNLISPYAEQFSLMQKLTQQYQSKFPGNLNSSALAPDVKQFLGQHQDKLKAAQEQLASLKQRYQAIASIQNLDSSALKRRSLKGQGRKRLVLGGKFEIASYAPFSLDLAPRLGYRIDKNLSLGITAGYRKTWGDLQNISLLPESFYYAGFVNYELFRSFYAYSEIGQNQIAPPGQGAQEQNTLRWARTFLVGVGKTVRLGAKMSLQTLLLYNFWHNPLQSVYPSRWVVRFGMQWDWQRP